MLEGCIGVLSSFKLDVLKGLSCISHSWFSGSDAFSSPSSLLVYFEVPALGVFCSRYRLFGTDCVLLFFFSFSIFSSFSSISFLKFATSLFVLSDILWVQICISFSFCVPLSRVTSSFLTDLTFSKLLKVSKQFHYLAMFLFRMCSTLKWGWLPSSRSSISLVTHFSQIKMLFWREEFQLSVRSSDECIVKDKVEKCEHVKLTK